MSQDYYKTLNVPRTASSDEIQKAYRRLARKYHPDLHEDKEQKEKESAKQKFQEVQNAYDVLSDPKKRQLYDQLGPNFDKMGGRNPFEEYAAQSGGTPFGNMDIDLSQIFGAGQASPGGFEEFLKQFGFGPQMAGGQPRAGYPGGQQGFPGGQGFPGQGFPGQGGQPQQRPPEKGRDLEETVTIPFATAILGGQYQLSLQRSDGKIENILVKIPAGIDHGKRIRLKGQGAASRNGGTKGDLLVKIMVASHPTYSRRGNDLLVTVPVTLAEAALGGKIELPSPHGTLTLTIPNGTSSGKSLRLKGMGVKLTDGTTGDLIAKLELHIPSDISEQDQELIEKLQANWRDDNPRTKLQW